MSQSGDTGMRFRVNLDVEKDWVIPADSVAEISAVSLLSANAIQITAGTGMPLAPGSEITSITAVNVMAEISKTADELTDIAQTHLAPLLGTLREVLDVEGRDALSSMSDLSGALATQTPQIMTNIESATANVADMTSRENVDSIRRTIDNVEQVSQEVVDIAGNAAEGPACSSDDQPGGQRSGKGRRIHRLEGGQTDRTNDCHDRARKDDCRSRNAPGYG